jgi:hypothetical protein
MRPMVRVQGRLQEQLRVRRSVPPLLAQLPAGVLHLSGLRARHIAYLEPSPAVTNFWPTSTMFGLAPLRCGS